MKLNIDYQLLKVYDAILDALLDAGAKEAGILGGAVRDMLLEKPIKDVDVFYSLEAIPPPPAEPGDWPAPWTFKHLNEEILYSKFKYEHTPGAAEYDDLTFEVTHNCLSFPGCPYPIQLIRVDDVNKTINNFQCGLSKVGYGEGLELTSDFLFGAENKLLVFTDDCPEKYVEKMYAKYEDYL